MLADLESVGFSLCSLATAGTGRRALFISCVCVSSIHEHAVHHFVWAPVEHNHTICPEYILSECLYMITPTCVFA